MGNASAKVGRINNNGIVGIVDPDCRTIALHIYDAIVKVSSAPVSDFKMATSFYCRASACSSFLLNFKPLKSSSKDA